MCMLVFLLTTAFCPPRTGVGGSRRQLSGGRRGSCAGAAGFLSVTKEEEGEEHCMLYSRQSLWPCLAMQPSAKACAVRCGHFFSFNHENHRDSQVVYQGGRTTPEKDIRLVNTQLRWIVRGHSI